MAATTQAGSAHSLVHELTRAAYLERRNFRIMRPTAEIAPDPGPPRCGAGEVVAAQGDGPSGAIADPVGALGQVVEMLDALAHTSWHEVTGQGAHDALDHLEGAARRLAAVRAEVLSVVDGNGLWAVQGTRTFSAWVRQRTGSTAGAASRQVRESRALRDHLPLTRAALAAGSLGPDHAGVLVREATRTAELRSQLADPEVGERFLVEQAAVMDAGTFTKLVQAWAIAADPEGSDRAWREADAKEELTLSQTTGGWQLRGWLDGVSGQVVSTALKAHAGRKDADDERTPAQRRAAALVALANQSLDAGLQQGAARIRPHLTVTVSLELLRALAAATGSAIPPQHPDGTGAAFGLPAQLALSAPGGPQDPDRPSDGDGGALVLHRRRRRRLRRGLRGVHRRARGGGCGDHPRHLERFPNT